MLRICSFLPLRLRRSAAEPADWIWSARYVITVDAQRRVIENGAVAIRGERIVAVGTERRNRRALPGRAAPRPARRHPRARPDRHPHARRHVAVPRHRRRPALAGLARAIHLPRRSQERHARFRALGHAPRLPRNAARRHHHLHRHVLLRGRGGRSGQGSRHARRAGRNHHRLPGGRCQDARRRAALHRDATSRASATIR